MAGLPRSDRPMAAPCNASLTSNLDDVTTILRALGLKASSTNPKDSATRDFNVYFSPDLAAPYKSEHDTIFLAVSVGEAYKINSTHGEQAVVALGCAKLDTRSTAGRQPGANGSDWLKHMSSYIYQIGGRQNGEGAQAFSATCSPSDVKTVEIGDIWQWLSTGAEPSEQGGRNVVVVCDYSAYRISVLEKELKLTFKAMPRVLKVVHIKELYENIKPAGTEVPNKLVDLCDALGEKTTRTSQLKARAEQVLLATLAIATKGAAASALATTDCVADGQTNSAGSTSTTAPGIEAAQTTAESNPQADHANGHFSLGDLQALLAAAQSQTATKTSSLPANTALEDIVRAPKTGSVAAPSTEPSGAQRTAPKFAPAPEPAVASPARPVTSAISYPQNTDLRYAYPCSARCQDPSFNDSDERTVVWGPEEITDTPVRVGAPVGWYTAMEQNFDQWIIMEANNYNYKGLSRITSHGKPGPASINKPIKNYDLLASHIICYADVHMSVIKFIKEMIRLRKFVTAWYKDLQERKKLPKDCAVAERTGTHQGFVDMLERLLRIFGHA
ncbi:hypothetical protein LTR56_021051 [Elasticomyces elasticus]|nr:hypothetical protein LTR56_021051 [Elasticomyces elasticus]KAK3635264.1 hypothetical protein LTR22_019260 [Elasticomyces elasticus]KAK4911634.1 hypothetical protein LTR49_019798 [Elasticomyces elasticus]KAK5748909.1 hypothetical protein LTS12_021014 [Elasticomyces elasticus]